MFSGIFGGRGVEQTTLHMVRKRPNNQDEEELDEKEEEKEEKKSFKEKLQAIQGPSEFLTLEMPYQT